MMKKSIFYNVLYGILMLMFFSATSQNIIQNYSFEVYSDCPTGLNAGVASCTNGNVDQIGYAPPWYAPTCGTADYFNKCNTGVVSVPANNFGFQEARTGSAYVGFYTYYTLLGIPSLYREYVQYPLTLPLIPQKLYYLEFYVSMADKCGFASQNIGAFFSTYPIVNTSNYNKNLPYVPLLSNSSISLSDKNNWIKISGCFTVDSAYSYITIGNFYDDVTYPPQNVGGGIPPYSGSGYYYLDDVSLKRMEVDLGRDTILPFGKTLKLDPGFTDAKYLWSTGETTQTITISTEGTYSVEVTSAEGCIMTDEINIGIEKQHKNIKIPNVYTPNRDGINDSFIIITEGYTNINCKIFNRWGDEVFELKNAASASWDGIMSNGKAAEPGVYYYIVKADTLNEYEEEKGFFHLLR